MKYGALPDSVLYVLVIQASSFDATSDEKLLTAQRLRSRNIDDFPGGVLRDVETACAEVRREQRGDAF